MLRSRVLTGLVVCIVVGVLVPIERRVHADMGALVDSAGASTQARVPMRYLALGATHTCVVMEAASVRCFGGSSLGQLGLGTIREVGASTATTGSYVSVTVAPATALGATVLQLAAGADHTCALLTTGAVQCWGAGDYGQLGYGDTITRGDALAEMGAGLPTVDLGTGRTARAIAAGSAHSCALLDNATVKCWGDNYSGQLGIGDRDNRGDGVGLMGDALPAVSFAPGRTPVAIAAGGNHTCAILDDDSLVCWGDNSAGQLGQGSTGLLGDNESVSTIAAVPVGAVRAVALGDAHTCVITTATALKCFGNGANGRLGTDAVDTRGDGPGEVAALPAIDLGAARSVRAVAAGGSHTCALLDNATVKCFGNGASGRLGTDSPNNMGDSSGEMAALAAVNVGGTVLAVGAGDAHTCVLLDDATVKCFGNAAKGQIGSDDMAALGDSTGEMAALAAVQLGARVATRSEPTQPRTITATVDATSATLSWLAPAGGAPITDYVVEYREDGAAAWTRVADGISTATSVTITGLTTDVQYHFRVAAVNDIDTGAFSTQSVSATPTTTTTTTTTTTMPTIASPTMSGGASSSVAPPSGTLPASTPSTTVATSPPSTPRRTAMVVAAFASYSTTLSAAHRRQLARMAASLTRDDTVTCSTFTASDTVVSSAGLRRATAVCRHLRELVPGLRIRVTSRLPLTAREERQMGVRGTGLMRRVLIQTATT